MRRRERLTRFKGIDIYPVTCQELSRGRSDLEVLDAVLAGGARIIQLREKRLSKKELYELAVEFRGRTLNHNALLIINDHADVALAAGADGVHLGQDDLPIRAARNISPDLIIGASCHNLGEALRAEKDGADYVNIGPIFPTKTKTEVSAFLGPDTVREIGTRLKVPYTTMGGITHENIRLVLGAGARHVAMITGITRAPDIARRVRELREIILSYKPSPE
ncbi:MAG: thiamine phosphate synthase [Thermodesulfobacteriota bacterium]|nr:thiamine phosphate synthase [Thermodesulfobacteriota bacterium]